MNDNVERLATAGLVYSLETALGRVVRESQLAIEGIPAPLIDTIRTATRNAMPETPTLEQLLENTYLSEAFALARLAVPSSEVGNALTDLSKWCEGAGVFALRNIVAHPNRRWLPHYWHLAQALATHPAVYMSELREVVEAHKAALAGSLEPPPDSWLLAVRDFEVPNNLEAVRRQQGLTTFYGRKQEKQILRKYLASEKVSAIALVGIGGLGKTALVVDTLQELARDVTASSDIHRILFLTAKTAVAAANGPRSIAPDFAAAEDVALALARELLDSPSATLQEAIDVHGDEKLILCLDNLEGILLEKPTLIDELLLSLPTKWKVIVTSRIPVNNAFTHQLARMNANDAKAMVFGYVRELGIAGAFPEGDAEPLVQKADTPLAIRLTLQGVAGGLSLPAALTSAATITAENAYSQLLEALPRDARHLAETLHAIGEPVSPVSLGLVLRWELSRVQESTAILRRFNLLANTDEQTAGTVLRDSLTEHLRLKPLDLTVRNDSHRDWQRLKGDVQVSPVGDTQDCGALGDVSDPLLRVSLHKILSRAESANNPAEVLAELDRLGTLHKGLGAIHRVKARVLESQGDEAGQQRELEAALVRNPADWRAAVELGERYRRFGRFDEACRILEPCISRYCSGDSAIDVRDQRKLLQLFYTAQIWRASDVIKEGDAVRGTALLEAVVDATRDWDKAGPLEAALGGLHAMAIRRLCQSPLLTMNRPRKSHLLLTALATYERLFSRNGPQFFVIPELAELVSELTWHTGADSASPDEPEFNAACDFLGKYVEQLMSVTNSRDAAARVKLFKAIDSLTKMRDGAFVDGTTLATWRSNSGYSQLSTESLADGYVVASVYAPANGRPYLFAADAAGQQYFVSSRVLADPSDSLDYWAVGTEVTGIANGRANEGKAIPLIDVRRVQ